MATKKYLDYAGLKRVLAKLLPGARKIWHGTLAEWENLSAAEKAKYDQAEVIDEYTGVPVVVDKVESGNLNPVTSNAVYDTLPEYYSKQLTVTPTGEQAQLKFSAAQFTGQKVLCKDGKTRIFGKLYFGEVRGNTATDVSINKAWAVVSGFPGAITVLANRLPCGIWSGNTGFYRPELASSTSIAPIVAMNGTTVDEGYLTPVDLVITLA